MNSELLAPPKGRLPALDGLRGIAILLVLLWHSVFQIAFIHHPGLNRVLRFGRFSWSGVDLFFVLSGFLIGGILLDNRDSPTYFQSFYARRAYRILPLYLVILAFSWAAYHVGNSGWTPWGYVDMFSGQVPWWSYLLLLQNYGMALDGSFDRFGLGVTWSLAIEEQFYLTLPFVVRRITRKTLVYLLAVVVCVAPILRAYLLRYWDHGAMAAYVLTPCRADALAVGVLCALLARNAKTWSWLVAHRPVIYAAIVALGLCLALLIARGYGSYDHTFYGLDFSVLAFLYAAVLLVAITGEDAIVRAVFRNSLLRKLGLIAYGTYLLHYICIDTFCFLVSRYGGQPSAFVFIGGQVLGVILAIVLASISWRWFEKPLVRRGHAHLY